MHTTQTFQSGSHIFELEEMIPDIISLSTAKRHLKYTKTVLGYTSTMADICWWGVGVLCSSCRRLFQWFVLTWTYHRIWDGGRYLTCCVTSSKRKDIQLELPFTSQSCCGHLQKREEVKEENEKGNGEKEKEKGRKRKEERGRRKGERGKQRGRRGKGKREKEKEK